MKTLNAAAERAISRQICDLDRSPAHRGITRESAKATPIAAKLFIKGVRIATRLTRTMSAQGTAACLAVRPARSPTTPIRRA